MFEKESEFDRGEDKMHNMCKRPGSCVGAFIERPVKRLNSPLKNCHNGHPQYGESQI